MATAVMATEQLLRQYSAQDLVRSLIREHFSIKSLSKSLAAFEIEDKLNSKKISKSHLLTMTSTNNLYAIHKSKGSSDNSILDILVQYLRNKFEIHSKSQQNRNEVDQLQVKCIQGKDTKLMRLPENKDKALATNEQKQFQKSHQNRRPSSAKPGKEIKQRALEVKNIYQKLNEVQILSHKTNQPVLKQKNLKSPPKLVVQTPISVQQSEKIEEQENYEQIFDQIPQKESKAVQNQVLQVLSNVKQKQTAKTQNLIITQSAKKQFIEQKQKISEQPQFILSNNVAEPHKVESTFNEKQSTEIKQKIIEPKELKEIKQEKSIIKQEKIQIKSQKVIVQPKIRSEMRKIRNPQAKVEELVNAKPKIEEECVNTQKTMTVNSLNLAKSEKTEQIQASTKIQFEQTKINPPTMMKVISKKQKNSNQQNSKATEQYPSKFKFDDNFEHIPKELQKPKYQYTECTLKKFIINLKQVQALGQGSLILKTDINYKQKFIAKNQNKKKIERPITQNQVDSLKKALFKGNNPVLPKSWHQGFILSPFQDTFYGLKQIQGGPCGIIAAVQCYFLKHLLYCSNLTEEKDLKTENTRQIALVAALTDILMKVKKEEDKIYLTIPPRNYSGNKLDFSSLSVYPIDANTFQNAFQGVWINRSAFIGNANHGVTTLLYSIVLTKGPLVIEQEIDCKENPLIGNHGHCTQELVNLFITGKASSNCFDGQKILDNDYKIKGIASKAQFGFLTIFETLKFIQVGKNLKNPLFPIWIICKQFHYHVIFAESYLISEDNDAKKFDLMYFDGLYNCQDKIRITLESLTEQQRQKQVKLKDLPLIEQVAMTKWGRRKSNWNGSIVIL